MQQQKKGSLQDKNISTERAYTKILGGKMRKTINDLTEKQYMKSPSNNWLKLHGFVMFRRAGQRQRLTRKEKKEYQILPFK